MKKVIKIIIKGCYACRYNEDDGCGITGRTCLSYINTFPEWCPLPDFTDPEHNPEQSPDNYDKTLPVSECANHGERSKLCEQELKV